VPADTTSSHDKPPEPDPLLKLPIRRRSRRAAAASTGTGRRRGRAGLVPGVSGRPGRRASVAVSKGGSATSRSFRVDFVGEVVIEARSIREVIQKARAAGITEITAIHREATVSS
jgi:hypothetical protein